MPDIVSIELLLDPQSEAAVRADWERLASAGLSSMAAHTSASNRPHVTVLVRPSPTVTASAGAGRRDALSDDAAFHDVVARLPIPARVGAPLLFGEGDRRVLARQVVVTDQLLDLHRRVHAAAGPGEDAAHTTAGEWTPHVTLARRLRLETLPEALRLLGPEVDGEFVSLRRWDAASATVTALG
jgi:hypothetical protein